MPVGVTPSRASLLLPVVPEAALAVGDAWFWLVSGVGVVRPLPCLPELRPLLSLSRSLISRVTSSLASAISSAGRPLSTSEVPASLRGVDSDRPSGAGFEVLLGSWM